MIKCYFVLCRDD